MIQELSNKIWKNEQFQKAVAQIERAWLLREILPGVAHELAQSLGSKAARAATILAASSNSEHRLAAYKLATCSYDLFGSEGYPHDQTLRVVLARLGNFPAIQTKEDVRLALGELPWELAAEEIRSADDQTISIDGRELALTKFQFELWRHLEARETVAISAPTSAGKSFILQNFLRSVFQVEAPVSVVYLVPTRALITQVSEDLAIQFRDWRGLRPEIVSVPIDAESALPTRAIYVMTQERVQLCLGTHKEFAANVVIVDEAHSVSDGGRGILLQWVIDDLIDRRANAQLLFAGPTIRNLDVFGRLFGIANVVQLPSVEPTVAQNFISAAVTSAAKGRIALSVRRPSAPLNDPFLTLEIGQTLASRKDKLVHIPARLGAGQTNIIYANGAAEAEAIAIQIADLLDASEATDGQVELAELTAEAVHEKYVLGQCVVRGVGFHYSHMPTILRRAVERAVAQGEIGFLVCTSTLLQGVNLPAKNLFMLTPEKGRGKPLASADFWNLSGRAGRLLREFQGNIFLIDYDKWEQAPLSGARDAVVVPAIEKDTQGRREELLDVIAGSSFVSARRDDVDLETTFGRLYSDSLAGKLAATLERAKVTPEDSAIISKAIEEAATHVDLPRDIVKRSPSISIHKQQKLFKEIEDQVRRGPEWAAALIPAHPRESGAFDSYAAVLERCYRVVLGLDTSRGLHRFHALMARKWMQGLPIPQIIEDQIQRQKSADTRKIIRDTLETIENQIRFQVVRVFGCYHALLGLQTKRWLVLSDWAYLG